MIGIHGILSTNSIDKKGFQSIMFKEMGKEYVTYQSLSKGLLAKISLNKFKKDKIFQKYDGKYCFHRWDYSKFKGTSN